MNTLSLTSAEIGKTTFPMENKVLCTLHFVLSETLQIILVIPARIVRDEIHKIILIMLCKIEKYVPTF